MSTHTSEFRTVEYSQTTITELMIPAYANFGGKIHGGTILSLMDKGAYACAAKHSRGYNVTASVNVVDFLAPVEVGELIHVMCTVNHVGTSSLVIGIKVVSENVTTGFVTHTNSCYFTMVAVDETGKPRKIPGLILETKDEVRRFVKAMKRKELISEYKNSINEIDRNWDMKNAIEILKSQNCKISEEILKG